MLLAPSKLQLLLILTLSLLAGLMAVVIAKKQLTSRFHAPGEAGRLGIRAGLFCALWAGGVLTLLATLDAGGAESAAMDRALRGRMWMVLAVSLASLLPSVLSGFVGGLIGGRIAAATWPTSPPTREVDAIPWLRWAKVGTVGLAVLALASPITFLGRAPVVDPAPVVAAPQIIPTAPTPPPFRYEPPIGIKSAKMGEIQPDFTKVISNVQSSCPVALSQDGIMIAFGDSAAAQPAVGIYDLHRFVKVASISVPAFPHGLLAWSSDQKSLACTIGEGQSRRVWILKITEGLAVQLPRPPGRDVPGGDLFWWQDQELAFFPEDEAPLAFDLQKLLLVPLEESPGYKKLDDTSKRLWIEGPRTSWPEQTGWKLGVRTLIKSAVPPPRREPDGPWQFSGQSVCAYTHPKLPLAFGFKSLGVDEGDQIICSPDGSKLMRLLNGKIEVTFMKQAVCPDLAFEVEMPLPLDEIEGTGWKKQVEEKQLCLLIYAPLKNPLNNVVVGPDYNQVRALARLLEWKGRRGVFIVQTHDGGIEADDIASTLHYWEPDKMSEWKPSSTRSWWTTIKAAQSPLPDKLPELETPQLLELIQKPSTLLVTKAAEKPRAPPPQKVQETPAPAPIPPPAPVTSEQDVKAFLTEHHAKASRDDLAGMIADYDTVVDFLDKGLLTRDAIGADEQSHRAKWPVGNEKIIGEIKLTREGENWQAEYMIEFYNENATGEWHRGRADLTLRLKGVGSSLSIISQRAKVYDVTNSKQAPKTPAPGAAVPQQPKGVAISVPKPCFVAVTQAKDVRQIEFTDQISFVNGITWHRTYREMSADGKALNTCRAIYDGSGGVSMDRRSARIYVGSQGWQRNLGAPEFVRFCERSASALVGREFNFQFTENGMIESNIGTTFKLVK